MKSIIHERPGVYSSYDASTAIWSGRAARVIGAAAKSVRGTANTPVTLTSYEAGVNEFGEDAPGSPGMSTMLRLLFLGGASTVAASCPYTRPCAPAWRPPPPPGGSGSLWWV